MSADQSPTLRTRDGIAPARVIAAIAVAVLAVVGVVVVSTVVRSAPDPDVTGPLAVSPLDAPGAGTQACRDLMAALPEQAGDLTRRPLADVAGAAGEEHAVAGWGPDEAVVLRCGLDDPAELTCSSALSEVNGVAYLPISVGDATTWLAVDRSVRIAVSIPPGVGTAALQDLSEVIAATLPQRAVCTDGVLLPLDR
ncbi:DUF3515 domain-containing protein [Nakamurella leprariae]|uniref:DUF3515 domain-containing protein n=1 Tax=Nakamurella leprariae TaxID=2803911 RepID=A0A938YGS0_9ACTN|nr:DUF3515 domain-containing protein [Nakamurella leprariae]MBM9468082.1 DUF3515 domain-containing protein [Nakamurella leprariae]